MSSDTLIKNVYGTNKQLRSTPGYTNYVVGVNKNLSGAVSSAILKRYYSNIDAEIYFNGEWVEDICNISWNISQYTQPLFGYNSYIWDDVAQGIRLINGMFITNFSNTRTMDDAISSGSSGIVSDSAPADFEDIEKFLIQSEAEPDKNSGTVYSNPDHYNIWANNFDIDIVCGENNDMSGFPIHIILKNCYITGQREMRMSDGDSVKQVFSFIARDFVTIQ